MTNLKGRMAIITGAAGGIGSAAARRLRKDGARVFLVDRAGPALDALGHELDAPVFAADVRDEVATAAFVAQAVDRLGGLDIYLANAGVEGTVGPLIHAELEEVRRVFETNVLGVWLGIKHAGRFMSEAGRGSIVATASVAGLVGSPGLGPYVASKHAVLGLVKTAAAELGPLGVRVNAVCPGPIDNRMMRSIEEQVAPGQAQSVKSAFEQQVPQHRYGTSQEVAAAMAFLASDDASYCNGMALVADGGFVAV